MRSEPEHAAASRRLDGRPTRAVRAVVAVPVRNEAERIGACLQALDGQQAIEAGAFGIVLFLNNCTDDTAREIAARRPLLHVPVRVIARDFPGAHAGWARREAMEHAAAWLEEGGAPDGVVLTTDADSRVAPDWVRRNLAALAGGADAVAGRISLDPDEASRLPPALHARGRLEGAYEALLTELSARIDPQAHDPWLVPSDRVRRLARRPPGDLSADRRHPRPCVRRRQGRSWSGCWPSTPACGTLRTSRSSPPGGSTVARQAGRRTP